METFVYRPKSLADVQAIFWGYPELLQIKK